MERTQEPGRSFVRGVATGAGLSLLAAGLLLYLLAALGIIRLDLLQTPQLDQLYRWLMNNLGLSVLPFGVTLLLYLHSLGRLSRSLESDRPCDEVVQLAQLTDVWISLFIGIGVIWTAIGMRSALLHALGDTGAAIQGGAFGVLQRLVDGGILTALSTTILGGAGGYLMRLLKSLRVGGRLNRYQALREADGRRRIEQLLVEIRDAASAAPGRRLR
ncbi:MAG TPA: hypothetical protein ENI96_15095 [Sedimenticola thiotaurini]|uniref:MotA/TolQ/ExbB proton channel domain-containing protein n=1 Tax=Sedimenticola thiotaurini TaxID=1543721 RepID=A0A831WBY1_9GAMM|nr:hypothetical protein [Sedimenticola thiotaurini]